MQASLVFLQKKTAEEMLVPYENEDYEVFMAIVEHVGKDRRGVPVYKKDEDGAELLFGETKEWIAYLENGREMVKSRKVRVKKIDDDLPETTNAYRQYLEGMK